MMAAAKKKKKVHIYVDEDLFEQVGDVSRELDCSKSTIIVQALRWWLRGRGNRRRFLESGGESVKEF